MAQDYEKEGFRFIFVYTREAHPGENFPAHRNLEQKMSHALSFKERLKVSRSILVDDLTGSGHKKYGELPNMTYVVAKTGRILFRSDWTDPPTIKTALEYIQSVSRQRREGTRLAPFYAEIVGYRWGDLKKHHEVLKQAGPQAMDDWERSQKRSSQQAPRPGRIQI